MKQKRKERVAGIGTTALRLGVTRQHLRHVLAGRRQSRRLLVAYHELVGSEKR